MRGENMAYLNEAHVILRQTKTIKYVYLIL